MDARMHEWEGPVTDPGIAQPGTYRCRACGAVQASPAQNSWAVCMGEEAIKFRAELNNRPNLWGQQVDLVSAYAAWMTDPDASPAQVSTAIEDLSGDDARALVSHFYMQHVYARNRSDI